MVLSRWWRWHGGFVVLVGQRTLETLALVCGIRHVCCRIVCLLSCVWGARAVDLCAQSAGNPAGGTVHLTGWVGMQNTHLRPLNSRPCMAQSRVFSCAVCMPAVFAHTSPAFVPLPC